MSVVALCGCTTLRELVEETNTNRTAAEVKEALRWGRAVLLTPTPNGVAFSSAAERGRYRLTNAPPDANEYTPSLSWQNIATGTAINFGDSPNKLLDMRPLSNTRYRVMIVDPGTYKLVGSKYETRKSTVDLLRVGERLQANIGTITLTKSTALDTHYEKKWVEPRYSTERRQNPACKPFKRDGDCGATSTLPALKQPPEYRDVPITNIVDTNIVETNLSTDFATFTVHPGEVLLTDILYERLLGPPQDIGPCTKPAQDKLTCPLQRYALYMQAAEASTVQQRLAQIASESPLYNMLGKFQYRPLKMGATKGLYDSIWKQEYYVSADGQ